MPHSSDIREGTQAVQGNAHWCSEVRQKTSVLMKGNASLRGASECGCFISTACWEEDLTVSVIEL